MFSAVRLLVGLLALAVAPARAASFKIVHTFASGDDGANPIGGMILAKGMLYGTTSSGGADNMGTLFQFDPVSGDVTTLYAFQGGDDGAEPFAAPIYHKGVLYGTAEAGGDGYGTVWAFNLKSGELTSLHVFSNGDDGAAPEASLRSAGNLLYGTATTGGVVGCNDNNGCGTVFAIDLTSGEFTTVVAFPKDTSEGDLPEGGMQLKNGLLYGTTLLGGMNDDVDGQGTLFALDPGTGDVTSLHVFDGTDGAAPLGNLLFRKGVFYGAASVAGSGDCGTLFSYDTNGGGFTALYQFTGPDGRDPKGGMIFRKGLIYGTTLGGGTGCSKNCGTVFSINPTTGALTTLYNFTGGADGYQPWGGLVYYDRTFYGTTVFGGDDFGTIFSLKP
jgi:uncharacterized repeat protein (TIGR03803 family)